MKNILELNHFKSVLGLKISSMGAKRVSLMLAGGALLFFIVELAGVIVTHTLPFRSVPAETVTVPSIAKTALEPLESFEAKLTARNLFFSAVKEAPVVVAAGIEEKVKSLSLIGIVATGEPEAIVKDSVLNQTYFLKRGQKLRDLEVGEVKSTSIILKSGNEQKEIFLA